MRARSVSRRSGASDGLTLVEVLVALALAAFVLLGLNGVVRRSLGARDIVQRSHQRTEQARFALERMVRAVQGTRRLLIPRPKNLATPYLESVRDVLAVELDPSLDRDGNGVADADNDADGRVDEDPDQDMGADSKPGLPGLDDDGDGVIDDTYGGASDDDEDGLVDEDPVNGVDDDGDGEVDEDAGKDLGADGAAGVIGVDDDGDGSVDEGNREDDDEDGVRNEDRIDATAWFVSGGRLLERSPTPGAADGTQYTESPIADGVTLFRVERVAEAVSRATLVDITLELTDASGEKTSLNALVRVGGGG